MAAEQTFTLATFFENWKRYQDHIKTSVAPLTAEQLQLRAAPDLRSVGENVVHIIGCRAGWFTYVLKEDGGPDVKATTTWDEPGAAPSTGAELAQALDWTFAFMMACIAKWSDDDMRQTFEDEQDGKIVQLSRAWIVWHVLEHDLHHGGEVSMTLGMHGIPADFPG